MNKDKIRGMFLGIAIGDALGKCVETWDQARIAETYGRITDYHVPDGHKWFNGHKAGTTTDDCQLTLAVAEGIIDGSREIKSIKDQDHPIDLLQDLMKAQAKQHISAFNETTDGWGRTTREACRRLANGASWSDSGSGGDGTGNGNGVAMKIAPVGFLWSLFKDCKPFWVYDFVVYLNDLTHKTTLALTTSLLHTKIVSACLDGSISDFNFFSDLSRLCRQAESLGKSRYELSKQQTEQPETLHRVSERFHTVFAGYKNLSDEDIIKLFGGGSCYCYDSLPFTWAFFFRDMESIDALYDVISAGGDTDSNGSMVGGLLGAYHGTEIFPEHLVNGLLDKDKVLDVADRFAAKFELD